MLNFLLAKKEKEKIIRKNGINGIKEYQLKINVLNFFILML